MCAYKLFRTVCPARQNDVGNGFVFFCLAHLIFVGIYKHFGQVKQFRDEFLEIKKRIN